MSLSLVLVSLIILNYVQLRDNALLGARSGWLVPFRRRHQPVSRSPADTFASRRRLIEVIVELGGVRRAARARAAGTSTTTRRRRTTPVTVPRLGRLQVSTHRLADELRTSGYHRSFFADRLQPLDRLVAFPWRIETSLEFDDVIVLVILGRRTTSPGHRVQVIRRITAQVVRGFVYDEPAAERVRSVAVGYVLPRNHHRPSESTGLCSRREVRGIFELLVEIATWRHRLMRRRSTRLRLGPAVVSELERAVVGLSRCQCMLSSRCTELVPLTTLFVSLRLVLWVPSKRSLLHHIVVGTIGRVVEVPAGRTTWHDSSLRTTCRKKSGSTRSSFSCLVASEVAGGAAVWRTQLKQMMGDCRRPATECEIAAAVVQRLGWFRSIVVSPSGE